MGGFQYGQTDSTGLAPHRTAMAGTIGVTRPPDDVNDCERHPEAKAADQRGSPAGPDTIGLLGRLRVRSKPLARIGKQVDRPG